MVSVWKLKNDHKFLEDQKMRTMLKIMKMPKNKIPKDKLDIFENIIQKYYVPNSGSVEGDIMFMEAMGEQLTEEQRFRLFEQNGGCRGFSHEKERKAFALKHKDKTLSEKLKLYLNTFGDQTRDAVLNKKNKTITVKFACNGCYKRIHTASVITNYEHCAGGRLDNLQTALGIKLKIKSVDISALSENIEKPCVFIFGIME